MLTFVAMLTSAIVALAPWVPRRQANHYARIIVQVAETRRTPAVWLAAHVWVESRFKPDHRSRTNDYGLAQIHVAARGSATFLGRERELLIPWVNLHEAGRISDMWIGYHVRECMRDGPPDHHAWGHMKWGRRVRSSTHADLVAAVAELFRLQMRLVEWVRFERLFS